MGAPCRLRESVANELLSIADRHLSLRKIETALRYYDMAYAQCPEFDAGRSNRWKCLALLGLFERAWNDTDRFEAERRISGKVQADNRLPLHLRRIWNGESLSGRDVHVSCYHGLGDTLQFVRYASAVKEVAKRVTIECQPSLIELVKSVQGVDEAVPLCFKTPEERSVHCELMELPYIFRTTLETIPNQVPYISVGDEMLGTVRTSLFKFGLNKDCFNLGIVWKSGDWNPARNLDVRLLRRLSQIPGVELFSLQKDLTQCELNLSGSWMHILDGKIPLTITDTAALILCMDLVVSVDTMSAHLAGALGANVWTLLPFDADWRWMASRNDTPWYPTMRLFRQPRPNTWVNVVDQMHESLRCISPAKIKGQGAEEVD
jgi:hypothetical protein